jgi:uroporphyrinogen III methyltransferase/synthase
MKTGGKVFLVGAGPGDPGLLTLRGADLMRTADVVVYDALVNLELLKLAASDAEIVFGGRRAKGQRVPQEDILKLLIKYAKDGRTVVRLKGGDPYLFGRGGEEAEALADAGVPFEVVPGVSSFAAVPAYAGIPLTHRDHCSKLTILTGHQDPDSPDCVIDWAAEARSRDTKVIMMGTERVGLIAAALMRHGLKADTPAALISWGSTGRQRSIAGTLQTIGELAAQSQLPPPAITVIGEVVRLRKKLNWFERLPLFGQRIVITRSTTQAAELAVPLTQRGAEVLEIPCIKIGPPTHLEPLKDAILGLHEYNWLVFTSANGVRSFFEYFERGFDDARDIGGVRFAAVGPATAAALHAHRMKVDAQPKDALGVNVAKAIRAVESIENLRFCLLRAEVASPELPQKLEELGGIVDDVAVYRTLPESHNATPASESLLERGADWITFTSGSTVQNFHDRFDLPALMKQFPKLKLASIGPETSKAIGALGLKADVEAKEHTVAGLVMTLENSRKRK